MSNKTYTFFDALGQITKRVTTPAGWAAAQLEDGMSFIEGEGDFRTQYVDPATKTILDKPSFVGLPASIDCVANGVDVSTISGLPVPTRAVITGPVNSEVTVVDTTLELTFDLPGTYTVELSSLNTLDGEVTINAA